MLDAILVVFNREFGSKDTFVNEILTGMRARGRTYKEWMTPTTPLKVLVHPKAKDPATFTAQAMVQFRTMGITFSAKNLEYATFDGNNNVFGSVVTHWSDGNSAGSTSKQKPKRWWEFWKD